MRAFMVRDRVYNRACLVHLRGGTVPPYNTELLLMRHRLRSALYLAENTVDIPDLRDIVAVYLCLKLCRPDDDDT